MYDQYQAISLTHLPRQARLPPSLPKYQPQGIYAHSTLELLMLITRELEIAAPLVLEVGIEPFLYATEKNDMPGPCSIIRALLCM